MPFEPKTWVDAPDGYVQGDTVPAGATPVHAAALNDLEARVAAALMDLAGGGGGGSFAVGTAISHDGYDGENSPTITPADETKPTLVVIQVSNGTEVRKDPILYGNVVSYSAGSSVAASGYQQSYMLIFPAGETFAFYADGCSIHDFYEIPVG